MNKRWFVILCGVALILSLALAACSKKEKDNPPKSPNNATVTSPRNWTSVTAIDVSTALPAQIAAAYPELAKTDDSGATVLNGRPIGWALSPDGTKLLVILEVNDAATENYTCLYTLADEALVCHPYVSTQARLTDMPEGLLVWAPDNDHLVTHYNWMRYADDPDLILLEASTGLGVVVTEDRYYGNVMGRDSDAFAMDYAPFWAPDSRSIYFFRVSRPVENWADHVQLYNVVLDGGATTLVADLAGQINGATFGYPSHVAASPDGKQAVIVSNNFGDGNTVNIWRVDLTTGKAEVWVNQAALYQALVPTWMDDPGLYGLDVAWSADGKYVVVSFTYQILGAGISDLARVPPLNEVIIEAATGQLHTLVDVASLTSADVYQTQGGFNGLSPQFCLLTPDGQTVIYATTAVTEGSTLTTMFWSVPIARNAAPVQLTTLDLPRLLMGRSDITDRMLGTLAPNGVALVQGPAPFRAGAVTLLQFSE